MATVPGSLVWEIVKKNNSFLAKEFGNGNQMAQFRKESNNIYNLNSFKYSGVANKKTVTVQPAGKDLGVVLATTKSKKQNKPAKLLHKSVMNKEFRIMATAVADQVETLLNSVKWDDKGLAVAIAQHVDTGAILMQGFANKEALATTISSRKATFYSRSRSSLWTKGETSNNFINVDDIFLDCDHDSIIYLGKPDGPTCHTGSETCYYFSVNDFLRHPEVKENRLALTTLYALESTISKREAEIESVGNGKPSWTKKLLLDQKLLCSKIREEADELCRTLEENEDKSRAASEAADVIFHSMVLLRKKDVKLEEVLQVLRQRFSQSGIDEKNSRK